MMNTEFGLSLHWRRRRKKKKTEENITSGGRKVEQVVNSIKYVLKKVAQAEQCASLEKKSLLVFLSFQFEGSVRKGRILGLEISSENV